METAPEIIPYKPPDMTLETHTALSNLIVEIDKFLNFQNFWHNKDPMLPHFLEPWFDAMKKENANMEFPSYLSMLSEYRTARSGLLEGGADVEISKNAKEAGLGAIDPVTVFVIIVVAVGGCVVAYMAKETVTEAMTPEEVKVSEEQREALEAQIEYMKAYVKVIKENPQYAQKLESLRLEVAKVFKIDVKAIGQRINPWILLGGAMITIYLLWSKK